MSANQQGELFSVDAYGVHKCHKCGSLGTIVELGKCCLIAELVSTSARRAPNKAEPAARRILANG